MQLLCENYGIVLDAAMPDDTEPQQHQPYSLAKVDTSAQELPAVPTEIMQHQTIQIDANSIGMSTIMPQTESSAVKTSAPIQLGDRLHDPPTSTAEAGPRKTVEQRSLPPTDVSPCQEQSRVPGRGVEAPRLLTDLPAAVPGPAAFSTDDGRQALYAQAGPLSAELMHEKKGETVQAGQVPDSLAMDTCTLQELTTLPSAHGHIPFSLKSPLPMAAARPAPGRGRGRPSSALTRPARAARPSPARAAASTASRQRPSSKTPGMGSWSAGSQDASRGDRLAHPPVQKQLQFDTAHRDAPGRCAPTQKEAPGSVQGTQTTQGLPHQHAKPQEGRKAAAVRSSHQKPDDSHRAHAGSPKPPRSLCGAASSDSDTPRAAAAWLPQPVQQAQGLNPLYDPRHSSEAPQAPELRPAQPAGIFLEASLAAQGAGRMPGDQAETAEGGGAAGPAQQLHQESGAAVHVRAHTAQMAYPDECCIIGYSGSA